MAKVKKGLILEGGAMRGLFTSGILDILMENNITFDGIVGVSAGAIFGSNFKSKQIGRTVRYNKKYCTNKKYGSIWSFIKSGDLYDPEFCYHKIPYELDPFDFKTFKKNKMEFYVTCIDVETGLPVYHLCGEDLDKDIEYLRASGSIPIVSKIVEIDGKKLLDGGACDSVPIKFFQQIGYQKNVVILTQPYDYVKNPIKHAKFIKFILRKYPLLFEQIAKRHIVYNDTLEYIKEEEKKGNIFVIRPPFNLNISHIESDPNEIERVYQIGRSVGNSILPELIKYLEKK